MTKLSELFSNVHNEILNYSEIVQMNIFREQRVLEITAKCVKMVRYESVQALETQIIDAYNLRDANISFVYDKSVFNANSIGTLPFMASKV